MHQRWARLMSTGLLAAVLLGSADAAPQQRRAYVAWKMDQCKKYRMIVGGMAWMRDQGFSDAWTFVAVIEGHQATSPWMTQATLARGLVLVYAIPSRSRDDVEEVAEQQCLTTPD